MHVPCTDSADITGHLLGAWTCRQSSPCMYLSPTPAYLMFWEVPNLGWGAQRQGSTHPDQPPVLCQPPENKGCVPRGPPATPRSSQRTRGGDCSGARPPGGGIPAAPLRPRAPRYPTPVAGAQPCPATNSLAKKVEINYSRRKPRCSRRSPARFAAMEPSTSEILKLFCVYFEGQRTHSAIQLPRPPPGSLPRTAFQPRGDRPPWDRLPRPALAREPQGPRSLLVWLASGWPQTHRWPPGDRRLRGRRAERRPAAARPRGSSRPGGGGGGSRCCTERRRPQPGL